jgi:hypothetical protein
MNPHFVPILLIALFLLPFQALGLAVGEKAPLFEAPSTHGMIKLGDYLGKKHVVLAFYFKDFTSG